MECATVLWRHWHCLRSCHSAHAWAHIWRGTVFLQLLHIRRTFVLSVYATFSKLWHVLCSVAPCVIVRTEPKFGTITHQRHVCINVWYFQNYNYCSFRTNLMIKNPQNALEKTKVATVFKRFHSGHTAQNEAIRNHKYNNNDNITKKNIVILT